MAAPRSNALPVLVASLLAAVGLFVFAGQGQESVSTADPAAAADSARDVAERDGPRVPMVKDPSASSERASAAAGQDRALRSGAPVSTLVEVFVLDSQGRGLLDPRDTELTTDQLLMLQVKLVSGEPVPRPAGLPLRRKGSFATSKPGWYTAIVRPAEPSYVVLCLGDLAIASAPIQPDEERVMLVVDAARVAASSAGVRGLVPGLTKGASRVSVRPIAADGSLRAPILAQPGEGDRFEILGIPPGPVRVEIGVDQGRLAHALHTAAQARNFGPISLGARAVDRAQWDFRLSVLAELKVPFARMEVDLEPR